MPMNISIQTVATEPGQTVVFVAETLHTDGYRAEPPDPPRVMYIYDDNDGYLSGYPEVMTLVSLGLYTYSYDVPAGYTGQGFYTAEITWLQPESFADQYLFIVVHAIAPIRNSYVSPM